jgi:uncharacterized integral membrane protein
MTKDFSYLENTSKKKMIQLMILSGGLMMAILIGSWIYINYDSERYYYMTLRESYLNGMGFTLVLIGLLIGAVIIIHKAGGIRVRDIPAYQGWCQDEFKRIKEENKQKK